MSGFMWKMNIGCWQNRSFELKFLILNIFKLDPFQERKTQNLYVFSMSTEILFFLESNCILIIQKEKEKKISYYI